MKKILFIIAWMGLAVGAFYIFAGHVLSSDEGVVLNAAWQIWNGKMLYTDFRWYIAPGTPEAVVALWKLFGTTNYGLLKIASICSLLFSGMGLAWGAAQITTNRFAPFFTVILWLSAVKFYPLINHNTFSSIAAIIVFVLLLRRARGCESIPVAIGLGLSLAFTTALLQTKGGVLFIATLFLFFYLRASWREYAAMIAAWAIALTLYLLRWSPTTLYQALFIYPNQNYWGPNHYLNHPQILVIEVFILVILAIWSMYQKERRVFVTIAVMQAALWISSANIFDIQHMFVNAFPLCVLLALLLPDPSQKPTFPIITVGRYVIVVLLVVGALASDWRWWPGWSQTIYATDFSGRPELFAGVLKIYGISSLYAGPNIPGLYYELGADNPFPYAELTTPDAQAFEVMKATMIRTNPEYVVLDYYDMAQRYHYSTQNVFDEYIASHYKDCGAVLSSYVRIGTRTACPNATSSQ